MDGLIPVALVGGGIAYVLAKQEGVAMPPGCTQYATGTGASTFNDLVNGVPCGGGGYYDPWLDNGGQAGFNLDGRLSDPDARQKIDLLQLGLQKSYDAMDGAARATAADQMNKSLNLDPPLRGNEDWQTVARVAGSVGGGVACNAIPGVGTAVSPLCAMAGAYLGVKLEDWMATELGGLQSWVSDNLGAIADAIGDQVTSWFNDIF